MAMGIAIGSNASPYLSKPGPVKESGILFFQAPGLAKDGEVDGRRAYLTKLWLLGLSLCN